MFSNELAKKLINLPKEIDGDFTTIILNDDKTRIYLKNSEEPEIINIISRFNVQKPLI